MKETKTIIIAALTALIAYCNALLIPIIVLFITVIVDYITGMIKAYMRFQLNSKIGFRGILKKISYFIIVAVGMGIDWLIQYGLSEIGITYSIGFSVACFVIIWLIINELISILENVSSFGVALPSFLLTLIKRLKKTVDEKEEKDDGEHI